MSELTNNHASGNAFKRNLLVTASSMVLAMASAETGPANAADDDNPIVWVQLGGQLETVMGADKSFDPKFLSTNQEPIKSIPARSQLGSHYDIGGEAEISFQPADTDWVFSASVRYGRAKGKKHLHHQSTTLEYQHRCSYYRISCDTGFGPAVHYETADLTAKSHRSHMIVDFQVGRDVGLGLFGRGGATSINLGVRFAQFSSGLDVLMRGRGTVGYHFWTALYPDKFPISYFPNYLATGHAHRNFHGVGPNLSLKGTAPVIGEANSGQLAIDWAANAALLFGRQRADVKHQTTGGYYARFVPWNGHPSGYSIVYQTGANGHRAHAVTVPNVGVSAAISYRIANFKVSAGYRADLFFGAMDTGLDKRKSENVSFYGPFATISVGLGR